MSSSSGRYQSRLLSFISRQSQSWLDRGKVAVRTVSSNTLWSLRVAATWGSQILLYPVYAAFQATRIVGRQLQQAVRQTLPQLQGWRKATATQENEAAIVPPATDTPIQQLLQVVETFSLPQLNGHSGIAALNPARERVANLVVSPAGRVAAMAAAAGELSATGEVATSELAIDGLATTVAGHVFDPAASGSVEPARVKLQGVASLLATRHLVLVTIHNQILDILTPEQQQHLRQQITWEVAGYWRQVRRYLAGQRHLAGAPPLKPLALLGERPHLLPPVQFFYRLMAWMQSSPVAIAANLFEEGSLQPAISPPIVRLGSDAMAQLTTANQCLHAAMLEAGEAEEWLTFGELWGEPAEPPAPNTLSFNWEQQQEIDLCLATIPQLPGDSKGNAVGALPAAPSVKALAADVTQRLVNTDLRQRQSSVVHQGQRSSELSRVPRPTTTLVPARKPLSGRLQAQPETSRHLAATPPAATARSVSPSRQEARSRSTAPRSVPAHSLDAKPLAPDTSSDLIQSGAKPKHAPNWIETEAITTGYVKHPLEQILGWVDRVMLWLENLAAKLWKWFTTLSRKKV